MKIYEYEDGMKVISNGIRFRIGGNLPVSHIELEPKEFDKLIANHKLTNSLVKDKMRVSERTKR